MTSANNEVKLTGIITKRLKFFGLNKTETLYMTEICTKRLSGYEDKVPVLVSDRMMDVTKNYVGRTVHMKGCFRSYNENMGERFCLRLYVLAKEFEYLDEQRQVFFENRIILDGFVCKKPIYRRTPLGREISDLFIAVNRNSGKSDYFPCVLWGKNAEFASKLQIGTHIREYGRIQSRGYEKQTENGIECRTTYEISVSTIEYMD